MSLIDFASGCLGGIAGVLVSHPFDTIKVIMQTNARQLSVYSVVRDSTMSSLYRGIKAPLSGLAVMNAILFGVHGNIMRLCPNESKGQTYWWCGLAGAAAGTAQSIITSPMELVKTRAQLSSQTVMQCTRHIWKNEGGIRGIYRGYCLTLARDAPGLATYFVTYEILIDLLNRNSNKQHPSTLNMIACGGTAGAASWLVVYPLDVIKSRLQADLRYSSFLQCVKDALRKEGAQVLMRGCTPTMMKSFQANAVTFPVVAWTVYGYESLWHSV